MTIAFVHENKAILPEISAYSKFFTAHGINCETANSNNVSALACEVEWRFMGTHLNRHNKSRILIHEYASLSTPPLADLKDIIKKTVNCKPDYRSFYNKYIQQKLNFKDEVPSGIRDYGVTPDALQLQSVESKQFDFIYVGSVDSQRQPERLLNRFTDERLKTHSIIILSSNYEQLAEKYKAYTNIHFAGPVPQAEVYKFIRQSRFGINYMRDVSPYNMQTSAKMIDYCACGVPVITTDYSWARQFENETGAAFFYLDKNLSNLNWTDICRYAYKIPAMTNWTWEKQIRKSGILSFLKSRFPSLQF
jgi:glycosyltransferase involved in cell wall biosynthesis